MFVAPQGSATQHKSPRSSRPRILLSLLPFLEVRGKSESAPSLPVAELLSWWLLRWILGLPQLGPAREQFKGCHLLSLLVGWLRRAGKRGFLLSRRGSMGLSCREVCPPEFAPAVDGL